MSDVFHTGSPDSPLWEFKHGNNNFKRGDLVGLREIKRRASRHALIHRDSFSTGPKAAPSQPATPIEAMPDPLEARVSHLEYGMYDVHARLARSEENYAYLSSKYHLLVEGLTKSHQVSFWAYAVHMGTTGAYNSVVESRACRLYQGRETGSGQPDPQRQYVLPLWPSDILRCSSKQLR